MESFGSLMFAIGASSPALDFVADLPTELSQRVLGFLDAESLVSAAQVSRRWMAACRGDPNLRRRARRHLRREKRRILQGGLGPAVRAKPPRGIHALPRAFPAPFMLAPTSEKTRIARNTFVSKLNRSPKSGSSTKRSLRI